MVPVTPPDTLFAMAHDDGPLDLDDYRVRPGSQVHLAKRSTDERAGLDKAEGKELTAGLHDRLADLQARLYAQGTRRVLIVAQAMDTGGKDGLIKRLLLPVNPQGVRIATFKAPSDEDRSHDYLWR